MLKVFILQKFHLKILIPTFEFFNIRYSQKKRTHPLSTRSKKFLDISAIKLINIRGFFF